MEGNKEIGCFTQAACTMTANISSTPLTRTSPIGAMVKQRAVGQGTDRTVSRRGALSQWRRWVTMFFSCILAFLAVET